MHTRDVPALRIAAVAAGLAATVAAAVLGALGWMRLNGMPAGGARLQTGYTLVVDGPALQSAPQPELAAYRAAKAQRLQSLGWVDAAHGVAHIPIDAAMRLIAQPAASAPEKPP
ncbi:MAG: hypothetical protein JNL85_03990 [Rubrivivax sp.]|nr:hypothetical protein [Rubrivivax sp.]